MIQYIEITTLLAFSGSNKVGKHI